MKINELVEGIVDEVSLKGFGTYAKKAQMDRAMSQMGSAFAASPEDREKNQARAARREKGLARHKTRVDKHWAEKNAKDAAEREQAIRDKFAGVDIDAEIAKLQPALKRAYHDYQYGARNTYSDARDDYNRISARIQELERAKKVLGGLDEEATAGGTSAGMVSVGAVHKNQSPKMQKPTDNALDGDNLMTGGSIKR
jgi:hypothetical protein